MPFDITRTLEVIENHLSTGGWLDSVEVGEPKTPPLSQLHAAIWMLAAKVVMVFGNGTRELHTVRIRIYKNMLDDVKQTELDMANVASDVISSFYGEFDLGETVVNIDIGGAYGDPIGVEFGYFELGNHWFRHCDIDVGLVVDSTDLLTE